METENRVILKQYLLPLQVQPNHPEIIQIKIKCNSFTCRYSFNMNLHLFERPALCSVCYGNVSTALVGCYLQVSLLSVKAELHQKNM